MREGRKEGGEGRGNEGMKEGRKERGEGRKGNEGMR